MLQQVAQKSAQTARLLPRRRERIDRTVVSAAEPAEMNMTEGNKNPQGHRTAKPRDRPLRPELPHEIRLGFNDESTKQIVYAR
jgi:hypothetical protein